MTAREAIAQLLDQWLHLTQRESHAIQAGDWKGLTTIQEAKAALQRPLGTTLAHWTGGNGVAGNPDDNEPFFRPMIDRLLTLETRNLESLAARKQGALERKLLIEQSARNLRMVRDSYAREPRMAWQVYS